MLLYTNNSITPIQGQKLLRVILLMKHRYSREGALSHSPFQPKHFRSGVGQIRQIGLCLFEKMISSYLLSVMLSGSNLSSSVQ